MDPKFDSLVCFTQFGVIIYLYPYDPQYEKVEPNKYNNSLLYNNTYLKF